MYSNNTQTSFDTFVQYKNSYRSIELASSLAIVIR